MSNLLEGFKEGKIGIWLNGVTQYQLDQLDKLIDIKWASGRRVREVISYAVEHKYMYYNVKDDCIYKSTFQKDNIEKIVQAEEFLDNCKNIKPIEEHDIIGIFT